MKQLIRIAILLKGLPGFLIALLSIASAASFVIPGGAQASPRFAHTAEDYLLRVAKGEIPGEIVVAKFGENSVLGNGTQEAVWDAGGLYVPPTVAQLHDVASTDADDDGAVLSSGTTTGGARVTLIDTGATFVSDGVAAGDILLNDTEMTTANITGVTETTLTFLGGWVRVQNGKTGPDTRAGDAYRAVTQDGAATGASAVFILGQGATRTEISEFVVLNGVADVSTALEYVRQYIMIALGGNTSGAEGVVTSTTSDVAETVSMQIVNGNNRTQMAIYTVPFDKFGLIVKWWGSLAGTTIQNVRFELRGGTLDGIGYLLQPRTAVAAGSSGFQFDYAVPLVVTGGADIWIEANASGVGTSASGGFDILLIDRKDL